MSFLIDPVVDRVVGRVAQLLAEPVLVRRALVELRSPSHTMGCSMGADTTLASASAWPTWQSGRAVIAPGRLVFFVGPGSQFRSSFDVHAVIETTYTRRRRDGESGPRWLGVRVLQTSEGKIFWSAHQKVLAEATAVLLG